MPAEDLGKVHVKVQLSDQIPGVIRDAEKVQHNFLWDSALLAAGNSTIQREYGTAVISLKGPDNSPLSAAVIPRPTFEPRDNYFADRVNDSETDTGNTYWIEQSWEKVPHYFGELVADQDSKAPKENQQKWRSNAEVMVPSKYSEADYDAQGIAYKGEGYQSSKEKSTQDTPDTEAVEEEQEEEQEALTPEEQVEETENFYVARQSQSLPGVWWCVKSRRFKRSGWPFWIVIRPSSINLRKGKAKRALLSVKMRRNAEKTRKGADQPESLGTVELVIDSVGGVYIYYSVLNPKSTSTKKRPAGGGSQQEAQSGSNSQSGNAENESKGSTGFIQLGLTGLSDAFASGEEIRIGLMPIMGRLCVYSDISQFQVVQFVGTNDALLQFDLTESTAVIAGYGCSASVSAFPMTFYKRAWMTLPKMGKKGVQGQKFPPQDQDGIKEGALADGRLISVPIPKARLDKALASKGGKGGAGKLYGAIFRYYGEVLLDADDRIAKGRWDNTKLTFSQPCWVNGILHPWGKIHLVRHPPKEGFDPKNAFWLVYFETQELDRVPIDPSTDASLENADAVEVGDVGFPSLYRIMSHKPVERESNPVVRANEVVDITDDVVSFGFDINLDSPRPTFVQKSGTVRVFNTDGQYSQYLSRARGIKVWVKWSLKALSDSDSEFGQPNGETFTDDDLVFTGIAFGRQSSQAPGEEYINFECEDHWHVLDSVQIKNSKFYDGFYIGSVVDDICALGGIDFSDEVDKSEGTRGGPKYYYLGQGTVWDKPLYRFKGDTTLKDCILETIKPFEVYVAFDGNGKLQMFPVPGGFLFNKINRKWNPDVKETYYLDIDSPERPEQLILDGIEISSTLSSSIYNSVVILAANRSTGALIIRSAGNEESLLSPNSVGYLGFLREIRLQRPDLGNSAAVLKFAEIVQTMYKKPGFEVEFNTAGHIPPFIPGEFVRLQRDDSELGGNFDQAGDFEDPDDPDLFTKKFRVTKIAHSYEASQNRWTTKIAAYQVESADVAFDPSQQLPQERPPEGE